MKRMYSEEELQEIIKTLIESGTIENAKPIYFHPVRFSIVGSLGSQPVRVVNGSVVILNNSPDAFDSFDKFRAYLYNGGERIDIVCSVIFYDDNAVYKGQILGLTGNPSSIGVTYTFDGTATYSNALNSFEFTIVDDKVKRIN